MRPSQVPPFCWEAGDDNTTIPEGCSSACCLCSGKDPELSSWGWSSHPTRSSCTTGACGPPPPMTHSQPSGVEQLSSFPVGSRVTYMCLHGAIRIPGALDTVQCLPGSYWSELRDPCGCKYPPFPGRAASHFRLLQ